MTTTYLLEYWDKATRQYKFLHATQSAEIADRMTYKPYMNRDWMGKRRLTKITRETIWESKRPR